MRGWVLVGVISGVLLVGCAAPGPVVESSGLPSAVVTPGQGQSLSALGFKNGPADLIWLPGGVQVGYGADQPNALIVTGNTAQAAQVEEFLRQTLPGLGWQITDDAPGGLLFEQGQWQGAYALGGDSWALTVRND